MIALLALVLLQATGGGPNQPSPCTINDPKWGVVCQAAAEVPHFDEPQHWTLSHSALAISGSPYTISCTVNGVVQVPGNGTFNVYGGQIMASWANDAVVTCGPYNYLKGR